MALGDIDSQLSLIFEDVGRAIQSTLENEITVAVKDMIPEVTMAYVYSLYVPTQYVRRGDGKKITSQIRDKDGRVRNFGLSEGSDRAGNLGLGNPEAYDTHVGVTRYGGELILYGHVHGNANYANSEGWDEGYIVDIVEKGVGYNWTFSDIYTQSPYPRPYMDKIFPETVSYPTFDRGLAAGLWRHGYETVDDGSKYRVVSTPVGDLAF